MYEHLRDIGTGAAAAKGWDGDRYQVVQVAGGTGIVWLTVWDTPIEGAEFRDKMERMVERRFGATRNSGGDGDVRSWVLRGRRLQLTQLEMSERSVVIWEDLPSAARSGVLDRARVVLAPN